MVVAGAPSLVSIVWNGCNRLEAAQACIRTLADIGYPNVEIVVQAGNSIDGTLEEFQKAAEKDSRIHVLSRAVADSGAGLLAALRACNGEYIGFWPMQGRLLPDSFEAVVQEFARSPGVGAVCGGGFLIDGNGHTLEPVDLITLLFTSYQPFLPESFFRRQALLECDLARDSWLTESVELELCLRLAVDFGIRSVSRRIADCPRPISISDGLPVNAASAIQHRMRILSQVFSIEGFFGPLEALHLEASVNQLSALWQRHDALGTHDAEFLCVTALRLATHRFHTLLRNDHRALSSLHRLFGVRSDNLGLLSPSLQRLFTWSSHLPERARIHVNYQVWNCTFGLGYWLKRKVIAYTKPSSNFHPAALPRAEMLAELYAFVASRYESRGQIDLAIEMWERARPPNNFAQDSAAAQALLRLPSATDSSIADYQKRWVERHIRATSRLIPWTRPVGRKIRIGYHCSFMDSDTIRYMMRDVMAAHDRTKFEIFGYSPTPYPADLVPSFDVRRDTRATRTSSNGQRGLSEEAFVAMVRRDEIDIFVELSGFSPGHRFRAMSERCAPVQVSFMNHTGSSQVPNVDYILTDEISTPSAAEMQRHYSETLWRLPGCFFCFDYRKSEYPPLIEPPSIRRGYTTFGCFGHGGKLNEQLIALWATLLHRCPSSMLHLQNPQFSNDDTRRFISNQFKRCGIASDRLVLAKGVDRNSLLSTYSQIDISLDTWPYCGGNTVAEGLWMGVPVVTLLGERFSARYGASLLAAAGCSDLIAKSPDEYVEIAASLAHDLPRLQNLRQSLRQRSIEYGLGDSWKFARNLETAYEQMLNCVR